MTDTGRSEELERLMDRYGDEIKRFCILQLKDSFQAEDAAQDTFVKAWKALDTFRNDSSEKTWLIRIAVNTCRDYQRTGWFRHMDRRITLEDLPERAEEMRFPDGEVSGAIASLPAKLRMVILLRYYEGFTVQETANISGVSAATAKRRIRKANQLLQKKLERWYDDE